MNRSTRQRLLALTSAGVIAFSANAAAQAELTRSGGVLGATVDYALSADPFELFVLVPSTTAGPLPLAIIDPLDTRSMGVGIDLLSLAISGGFDGAGNAGLSVPLPNNAALAGVPIYAQFVTLPGAPTLVDELSNVTSFNLQSAQTSVKTIGALPVSVAGHSQTELDDGTVLIAGGGATDAAGIDVPGDRLYLFDPQTQMVEQLAATLNQERAAHTATKLPDGRVLFLGGTDAAGQASNTGEIYDPVSGTSTPTANMAVARVGHTATALADGRVFVAGGITFIDPTDPLTSIDSVTNNTQVYNPTGDSFSNGPNMPEPRTGHNASRLNDGRVLLTAGVEVPSLFGLPLPEFSNDCRLYNPAGNNFQNTGNIGGDRALHAQLTLSDGRVAVAGGADGDFIFQTFNTLNSVWVYDVGAGGWTAAPNLAQDRAFCNLHEVGGDIVAIGGLQNVDVVAISGTPVDDFEVSTGLAFGGWSTVSTMAALRPAAVTTTIENGSRVLITGAVTDATGMTTTTDLSAETYVP